MRGKKIAAKQINKINELRAKGASVAIACKSVGISEASYYKLRNKINNADEAISGNRPLDIKKNITKALTEDLQNKSVTHYDLVSYQAALTSLSKRIGALETKVFAPKRKKFLGIF